MPGNPREIVTMAERRFPVRIKIGVPPSGFGQRYAEITEWLDGNCGADGWAITPSGLRGVLNDAVSPISATRRWRARSSPAGVRRPGLRRRAGYSAFVTMNRRRGSGAGLHRVRVAEEQPGVNRGDSGLAAASSRDHFRAANEED